MLRSLLTCYDLVAHPVGQKSGPMIAEPGILVARIKAEVLVALPMNKRQLIKGA